MNSLALYSEEDVLKIKLEYIEWLTRFFELSPATICTPEISGLLLEVTGKPQFKCEIEELNAEIF